MAAAVIRNGHLSVDFQNALDQISTALDIQTRRRYPELKSSLDTIHAHAENRGLPDEALATLINAITRPHSLDQSSQNALVKCLYPASRIPSELICIIIGSLGHGARRASVSTQQLLLRWIIMVSDYQEEPSSLTSFYSVLFNLLDMTNLRADLCHLLAHITRRKHVRPFRLQMLQDLLATVGPEPALLRLMHVFDKYAPGVLDISKANKRLGDFPHPDPEWGVQLSIIQCRHGVRPVSADLKDYVDRLDKVKLIHLKPTDLKDRTMQRNLALASEESSRRQVDECLSPNFEKYLEKSSNDHDVGKSLSEILDSVYSYTRFTKTLPQATLTFLESYLLKWDGLQNQNTVLELLTYLPILPFQDLQTKFFQPLETAILSVSIDSTTLIPQTTLLAFYTTILSHWTSHLLATPPPTTFQKSTLIALTNHIIPLSLTILTTIPSSTAISTILTYHSILLPLIRPPLSIPLAPPKPISVYLLLFTSASLSTLSGTSSIMASYKTTFETSTQPRPAEQIPQLNGTLIDTCNLLFRSRAFNAKDSHALGCLLPMPVVAKLADYTGALDPAQPLTSLFSLSHSPTLAALSISAFRELEEAAAEEGVVRIRHAGPITQKTLITLGKEGGVKVDWKEYRVHVLRWLEGMGVGGVRELGGATMKGLLGGPETPVGMKGGIAA